MTATPPRACLGRSHPHETRKTRTINNTGVRDYDVDGRTYALPRGGARVLPSSHPKLAASNLSWGSRTLFVRKDWMEKLGIDDPQTAEEFIEMCVRFVTDDPDGFTLRSTARTTPGSGLYTSPCCGLYQRGGLDPDFILNTGGFDSVDLFATDKAGLTHFQSVPVHYNGFVERWKQFNPDRNFFDHVKVLRPFPVDGYDFHGIGRAGETSFWSESFIAGTVDDEKMSRILDLYHDWLEGQDYSSEGTMTVSTRSSASPRDAVQYSTGWKYARPPSPRSSGHSVGGMDTTATGHRRKAPDHRSASERR